MKHWTVLIILISSFQAVAETDLKVYDGKAYKDLQLKTYKDLKLSESCMKNDPPTCEAFKATLAQAKESKRTTPLAGNPAAHYCLDAGGLNRIAKDSGGSDFDFCLFKDGSLVDSWDLYYKFHKRSTVK